MTTRDTFENLRIRAEKFRATQGEPSRGYVVFGAGEIIGWWDDLPNYTEIFEPNDVAVPEYRNSPCRVWDGQSWKRYA